MFHGCYITMASPGCHKGFSRVSQDCLKSVSRVLLGLRMLQWCSNGVLKMFKGVSKAFRGCFHGVIKDVLSTFQECFKGVSRAHSYILAFWAFLCPLVSMLNHI